MPKVKVQKSSKIIKDPKILENENTPSIIDVYTSPLDKHPYLKEILFIDPADAKRFICRICTENSPSTKKTGKEQIGGHIYWLRQHLETQSHHEFTKYRDRAKLNEAVEAIKRQRKPNKFIQNLELAVEDDQIKQYEEPKINNISDRKLFPLSKENEARFHLDMAYFMITNHLPYDSAPALLDLLKYVNQTYDIQLIERCHTSETTIKQIIRECICSSIREKIVCDLEESPFSIMMDASSDVHGGKYLAIFVRYANFEEGNIATKLLKIIELGYTHTGEALYNLLKEEIFKHNPIIRNNLIGISTDNRSNMISNRELKVDPKGAGVVNRLYKETPNLIFIRDMCHIYNLRIEKALDGFPCYVIQFIVKLCSYFNTGNRSVRLKEIQSQDGVTEPLEVRSYCSTRWESLLSCTERILSLWKYIEIYLEETDLSLKNDIKDPEYYLYTYLLHVLLHKLISYITTFEKSSLLFDQVYEKIKEGYTIFARMLLKQHYQGWTFEEVYSLPFHDQEDVLCREKLASDSEFALLMTQRYPRVEEYLKLIKLKPKNTNDEKQIFGHMRAFILETVIAMGKRLPFEDKFLKDSLAIYLKEVHSMDIWRGFIKKISKHN